MNAATTSWRDGPEATVKALAAVSPERLCDRLTADRLAVIARAVRVRSTGRKADVARLIVERCDLLARLRTLSDDPARLAVQFRRESLLQFAEGLRCYRWLNKYGLAATIINTRDTIYRSLAAELENQL